MEFELPSISDFVKSEPEPLKRKSTKSFKKLEPVYVRKLYEKCRHNAVKTGKLIMCGGNTISRAIENNKVGAQYELAAKGVWESHHALKPDPVKTLPPTESSIDVFIRCPQSKVEFLSTFLGEYNYPAVVIPKNLNEGK